MIHSTLYILLVVFLSLVNGFPHSYLENVSSLGKWISSPLSFENKTIDVKNDEEPKQQLHRVADKISSDAKIMDSETLIPIDDLLKKFEDEIEKKDTRGKKEILGVLQRIRQGIYDDSVRRVQVFLGGLWHVVDLGIAGSLQRRRSARRTEGVIHASFNMLVALHDWFCSWFSSKKPDDDDDDEEEERLEEPSHHSDEPSEHSNEHSEPGEPIKVTTKVGEKGEDHHKIIHKFEIDPFVIKLNMDITCRILDDSKKPQEPHNSHTPGSPQAEKKKVDQDPLEEEDDDWDYSDTEDKVNSDKKKASPTSPKDSKPTLTPPNATGKPTPVPSTPGRSTDIKGKGADANKSDKDRPSPDGIDRKLLSRSPSNAGGSNSQRVSEGGDKKQKKFEGNPVDWELVATPPPPEKSLGYSEMKRMIPQKTPPPPDDNDEDIDWGPGYDILENNPHMPNYKDKKTT